MSKNTVTLKCGSEVTQGHWRWYLSFDRLYIHCVQKKVSPLKIL